MRRFFLSLLLLAAWAGACPAQEAATPSFEVVKDAIDIDVRPGGEFWISRETSTRALTEEAAGALQQSGFSYTRGYEETQVAGAYILKKDGTRLTVPDDKILYGKGASSGTGYQDTVTVTVVFPGVEVGDQVTLITTTHQAVPWFKEVFQQTYAFPRATLFRDVSISVIAPADAKLAVDVAGLQEGPLTRLNGKTRRIWHWSNPNPVRSEFGAVTDPRIEPHLSIGNVADYAQVAKIYGDVFRDKAKVTPAITALADRLTAGLSRPRDRAKALYDWVTLHIKYVDLVLGAGGFVPHDADAVLQSGAGDCKDHVMLLEALLAAKGIDSGAVLINAGDDWYDLPALASPFIFNHLITYVPQFDLYLDSTSQYVPFGELPGSDAGRQVVLVAQGRPGRTPPPLRASVREETTLTLQADGSADGDTSVTASGDMAAVYRAVMASLPAGGETPFFRNALGANSDGKLQRGDPATLASSFSFGAQYHIGTFVVLPGPGAFPQALGLRLFDLAAIVNGTLPARSSDYGCSPAALEEIVTLKLPPGLQVASLPASDSIAGDGIRLTLDYRRDGNVIHAIRRLVVDDPGPVCTIAHYARIRPDLLRMTAALRGQVLYK